MGTLVSEMRTPHKNLLMFNVVEIDGTKCVEIRSRSKTDYVKLSDMIAWLMCIQKST